MKLLLTGAVDYSEQQIKQIENLGYEISFVQDERQKISIDVSELEVVVCNNLFIYNDIRKFKSLKFIQLTSAGFDRVPLSYIEENNIEIHNAKNVYSIPMAEWVILKILEIYKSSSYFYENQKIKQWQKKRELLELTNKKVGIIGYGNVGLEIAKRLQPFNSQIIAINRSTVESIYVQKYVPLDQLSHILPDLDVIILTVALTSETKNLISQKELELMKDNSVLVNVARGELINEDDLISVLNKGKFLGVALDVFNKEPLSDSPLWGFKNVLITPHNSFASSKNKDRLFSLIYENLETSRSSFL